MSWNYEKNLFRIVKKKIPKFLVKNGKDVERNSVHKTPGYSEDINTKTEQLN